MGNRGGPDRWGRGNGDREERIHLHFGSRGVIGELDAGTESTYAYQSVCN